LLQEGTQDKQENARPTFDPLSGAFTDPDGYKARVQEQEADGGKGNAPPAPAAPSETDQIKAQIDRLLVTLSDEDERDIDLGEEVMAIERTGNKVALEGALAKLADREHAGIIGRVEVEEVNIGNLGCIRPDSPEGKGMQEALQQAKAVMARRNEAFAASLAKRTADSES